MPSTQFPQFTLFQTRLHPFGSCLCLWDFTVATITSTHRFWISRMSPPLSKQNLSWTGNQSDLILSCGFSLYTIFRLTQRAYLFLFLMHIHSGSRRTQIAKPLWWTSIGHPSNIFVPNRCPINIDPRVFAIFTCPVNCGWNYPFIFRLQWCNRWNLKWISNVIPHFIIDAITDPCCE